MSVSSVERLSFRGVFLLALSAAFAWLAGYQVLGEARDYEDYVFFFDDLRSASKFDEVQTRFEPLFTAVSFCLTKLDFSNQQIFSFFVFVSMLFVLCAVGLGKEQKNYLFFSFFLYYYFSRYFVLFDATVLRAGCAFSLAFFVFYNKGGFSYKIRDVLLLFLAVLMHYSAVIFIFIYFLKPISIKYVLCVLGGIAAFFIVFKGSLIGGYVSSRSDYGIDAGDTTLMPIPFFLDIVFFILSLLFFKHADVAMKYATIGFFLSVVIHFCFLDYTIISSRYRELMSVFVLIFLFRSLHSSSQHLRLLSLLYVLLTGPVYIYIWLDYDPLLS